MFALIGIPADRNGDVPTLFTVGGLTDCFQALDLRTTKCPTFEELRALVELDKPILTEGNWQFWIKRLPVE